MSWLLSELMDLNEFRLVEQLLPLLQFGKTSLLLVEKLEAARLDTVDGCEAIGVAAEVAGLLNGARFVSRILDQHLAGLQRRHALHRLRRLQPRGTWMETSGRTLPR